MNQYAPRFLVIAIGIVLMTGAFPKAGERISIISQQIPIEQQFKQLDRNGDGKPTPEEAPFGDLFKQWDMNGDGVVMLREAKAYYESRAQAQRGAARNPAALQAGGVPMKSFLNLPYVKIEGADPKLTSLDIYAAPNAKDSPVLIWVHGGGWARGDKGQVAGLPVAFVREGFLLVSVNYRLAPAVRFEAQAQDVAAAMAWVHRHAGEYGGAQDKIFLMGHSAGAHLVALVGMDEAYLKAQGLPLSALRGVVPLDTEVYDIKTFASRFGGKLPDLYEAPFTQDPAVWKRASPAEHVARDKGIPPMIVAYSGGQTPHGNPSRKRDAEEFAARLKAAGVSAEVIGAPEKTHTQIALEFGTPNDLVAQRVFAFLKTILRASTPPSAAGAGFAPGGSVSGHAADGWKLIFVKDYFPGTKDRNGQWSGGTETMELRAHDGKLFASLGYWMDVPYGQPKGD